MEIIEKNIDLILFDFFKKYNYQEDLEIFQKNYDEYYNKIYNKIFTLHKNEYFNDISEKKLIEINKNMNEIFKTKYDAIISNNKLPIWKNIKSDIYISIKKLFEEFISKILFKKEFSEDVDLNLYNKKTFLNLIPKDFMQRNFVTDDKQNEIKVLINNEIDNYIKILNNKINRLPLFDKFIKEIIKKCNDKLNIKMKELFDRIDFVEDIILFDSDIMFSFIIRNLSVYENAKSKIEQINIKLRELCNNKADEYILQIMQYKPEWKNIKNNLRNDCEKYKSIIFKNVFYQEDMKIITKNDLLKNIKNLNTLYGKVNQNKKDEINYILEQTLEEINIKKNSLQKWSIIKNNLLLEAIIEMENILKSDFTKIKEEYKDIDFGNNERDMIKNILIWKIEAKKIFEQCLDKKRKDELYNNIEEKAKILANEYYIEEKKKKEQKIKGQNELKNYQAIINIFKNESQTTNNETAKIKMDTNNFKEKNEKLIQENSDRILAEKLEIEQLNKEKMNLVNLHLSKK